MKAPDYTVINCAECNAEVLENKLPQHIAAVHICKFCGDRPAFMDVHLEYWHYDETFKDREDAQNA